MNRKQFLKRGTLILFLVGLCYLTVPFIGSLKPNARALAALPQVDISGIKRGAFLIVPYPEMVALKGNLQPNLFIYRSQQNRIKVWQLYVKDGEVGLPYRHWWRPEYFCKNFGPTLINGVVDEREPILCHDQNTQSDWVTKTWRWDIDGKSLGDMKVNLDQVKGAIEGNYFVLYKP